MFDRRLQRIEARVITQIKRLSQKYSEAEFVVFVDNGVTKTIRKDFADRVLDWAREKAKKLVKQRKERRLSKIAKDKACKAGQY